MITFQVSVETSLSPAAVFEAFFCLDNWGSFKGYGPIPGIKSVELVKETDSKVGTIFRVSNSDGSSHEETVVEYEMERLLVLKMDSFTSPLNKIASHFMERWHVQSRGGKYYIERSFELYPKNMFGKIVLRIVSLFLRRAIENHTKDFATAE